MPTFELKDLGNIFVWAYNFLGWWLTSLGLAKEFVLFVQLFLAISVMSTVVLLIPVFTIWLERKVAGRFQDRLGPNRNGPYGLLQTLADVMKLLTKEDITPYKADWWVFNLAPLFGVLSVVGAWVVIPWASTMAGADINVGVLYIVGISGIGTLAIMMGGWASNNKFALLGAFRAVAQLVSYEVPMIITLLVPVLLAGSMSMQTIVKAQESMWFVVLAPFATLLFFITSIAEIGRAPFDLLEAESEIATGYNIEYTGMKFGIWMLQEFSHAFLVGPLVVTLFLGGWYGPWAKEVPILCIVYFMLKNFFIYFLIVWVRSTLPRIRIDHLMSLNWKFFVPVTLLAVVVTALVDKAVSEFAPGTGVMGRTLALLVSNILLVLAVLMSLRNIAHEARVQAEGGDEHDEAHDDHGHHGEADTAHDQHAAHPAPAH